MSATDEFARQVLEESKFLLELANTASEQTKVNSFAHSSLFLAFAALEAHVNCIVDDFSDRPELSVFDRSIFFEKDMELKDGIFELREKLKIYRLEDRIQYIYRYFAKKPLDKTIGMWGRFKHGQSLRNNLTHPKGVPTVTTADVERAIVAIIDLIDLLYKAVYSKSYPSKPLGLDSNIDL